MKFERTSGVLLHPTSLPGRFGIGELGGEAYRFADYLHGACQSIWQVLPLCPTGYGNSPYTSFSSFAGNPLLISIDRLLEHDLALRDDVESTLPKFPEDKVDFDAVMAWKLPILRKAYDLFVERASQDWKEDFAAFCHANSAWLDDFALFMALREVHGLRPWNEWEAGLVARNPETMHAWRQRLGVEVQARKFWEYLFDRQWSDLRKYCNERGIRLMGDLPIYVAHNSADVWANPELFHLDDQGNPTLVAGVPPDYFSATGQLWGNPLYRWDRLAETGFAWWVERIRASMARVDILRIDHFRAFESYWEVPAGETTAINGRWVQGPGTAVFDALRARLGEVPIVAENLGIITRAVEELRQSLGFPGMVVLQFGFGTDRFSPGVLPHMVTHDTVLYTGTHDNDTVVGWWNSKGDGEAPRPLQELEAERAFARRYLPITGWGIHWDFIRAIMNSPADTAIVPLQDVLGLGSGARMNTPGTVGENWTWRVLPAMLGDVPRQRLRELTILFGRAPGKAPVEALDEV